VFSLLAFLLLTKLLAWIPLGALAGILLVVAYRMVDWNAFGLLKHKGTRLDFVVIATVVAVAVVEGLLVAAGAGVALAILLYLRDQMRSSVIRRQVPLSQVHSKTHRPRSERELLKSEGEQGLLVEVQGDLFFGTTDQLYSELEGDLTSRRFVLLDLRRVRTLDYTAAHLLGLMQDRLAERGGGILLSGAPSGLGGSTDVERYLRQVGVVQGEAEGEGVRIFAHRDSALEWIEEQLLTGTDLTRTFARPTLGLEQIELFADLDEKTRAALRDCLEEQLLEPGQALFKRGDPGDVMFVVRSGAVRALLPLPGDKAHHVATFSRGDFFGELAFLDRGLRSADAVAKGRTELYSLSRDRFDGWSQAHPAMSAEVYERMAQAIAHRLRDADEELLALEER
jgi:SulP family sulfate permease